MKQIIVALDLRRIGMLLKTLFAVAAVSAVVQAAVPPGDPIPAGSSWKYYAEGEYPQGNWTEAMYVDSSWSEGTAPLGYGESYIATEIPYGPDAGSKYITTCFRIAFENLTDPEEIGRLVLQASYDDGFVAYLNGTEVARGSMPPGVIQYGTPASSHEAGTFESFDLTANRNELIVGTNVLAVEVHQRQGNSSDLVWDARLSADRSKVVFMWSGAVTDSSVNVKAKISTDSSVVRLVAGSDISLYGGVYSLPDTAMVSESNGVVSLHLGNLVAGQQYYYGLEVDGERDEQLIGGFRTFPKGASEFSLAFASCAATGSDHEVFQTILNHEPLFFLHMGDFHYLNIASTDVDAFRQGYEQVLSSPGQSKLYRRIPIIYMWDDHDYGPNNSDSTAPGRTASRLTYQEYVPHYPLVAGRGDVAIYQAFTVGRVRFILCDARSARSPAASPDTPDKTMLGTEQKNWFKDELSRASRTYAMVVWVNTLPWIGGTGDDGWYLYTNERAEIANWIKEEGIDNLCMLSGDAHMLAIDDGTNSDYASGGGAAFPVMHAAALDRSGSLKGGPYSHGAYPGGGQFGLMHVFDRGDSIFVDWSGRNSNDDEIVAYSFAFGADIVTGIDDESPGPLPASYRLYANYPNPFNPSTEIAFDLPVSSVARIDVFNVMGQKLATLIDGRLPAGHHRVNWDASGFAGGVYLYRLIADDFDATKKMVLLK